MNTSLDLGSNAIAACLPRCVPNLERVTSNFWSQWVFFNSRRHSKQLALGVVTAIKTSSHSRYFPQVTCRKTQYSVSVTQLYSSSTPLVTSYKSSLVALHTRTTSTRPVTNQFAPQNKCIALRFKRIITAMNRLGFSDHPELTDSQSRRKTQT